MAYVGILDAHFVYFAPIWYILWPFGIFHGYLAYVSRFGMLYQEKSGNPAYRRTLTTSTTFRTNKSI
jgi:hypothetical protein